MDWWSELWLNEGFATWVGWFAVDHLYPGMCFLKRLFVYPLIRTADWNVWGQFVVRRKSAGIGILQC